MATTRLLRSCEPLRLRHVPSHVSASSSVSTVKCLGKAAGLGGDKMASASGDADKKKSAVAVKAAVAATKSFITVEPQFDKGIDLPSLFAIVRHSLVKVLIRTAVKRKSWKLLVQLLIEKAIIDCRFFTLFAVVGSLLSSVLCFLEGCFLILESYFHYLEKSLHSSDGGHMVQLLIEAIDMFLVGTAMLIFGVGLYTIFVGSKDLKAKVPRLPASNLFGLFYLKNIPTWVQVDSVSQAKSKIGHAVMMILQVGLLDKFKNVPLLTSLDLACFAGAVLVSSASIFVLSKLSVGGIAGDSS